jgi:hypothetical protein
MNYNIVINFRTTLLESIANYALSDISVRQAFRKTTPTLADLVSVIKSALPAVAALLWPRMAKNRRRYYYFTIVLNKNLIHLATFCTKFFQCYNLEKLQNKSNTHVDTCHQCSK